MSRSVTSNYSVKSSAANAKVKKANNVGKDAGAQLSKTLNGFKSQPPFKNRTLNPSPKNGG